MAKAGSRVGRLQRRRGCNMTKQKKPNACPWSLHDHACPWHLHDQKNQPLMPAHGLRTTKKTIPNACPWSLHDQRQTIPNACPWSLRDHKEQSLMPALGQGRQPCRTPPAPAQLHCGQVDGEEGRWGGRRGEGLPSDPPRPPSHPHRKDWEGGRNRSHWRLLS